MILYSSVLVSFLLASSIGQSTAKEPPGNGSTKPLGKGRPKAWYRTKTPTKGRTKAPTKSPKPRPSPLPTSQPTTSPPTSEPFNYSSLFQFQLEKTAFGSPSVDASDRPIYPLYMLNGNWTAQPGSFPAVTTSGVNFSLEAVQILQTWNSIADILANGTKLEVNFNQSVANEEFEATLILGAMNGAPNYFLGLIIKFTNPGSGLVHISAFAIDDPVYFGYNTTQSRRDLQVLPEPVGCPKFFFNVLAAFQCPGGGKKYVDPACREDTENTYDTALDVLRGKYNRAILAARKIFDAGKLTLLFLKARKYVIAFRGCALLIAFPISAALCLAAAVALIELPAIAAKEALQAAFDLAVQKAIDNRQSLINLACDVATAKAEDCIKCQTPAPTPMPTPMPTPTPPPTPPPPPPGESGYGIGDVHMSTYDGLRYVCNGHGEFVLAKSLDGAFEVQARFTAPSNFFTPVTLTRAVSVFVAGSPIVQVAMAVNPASNATILSSCPILFFVDGKQSDILAGTDNHTQVRVDMASGIIFVINVASGIYLELGITVSSVFECFFNVFVTIPNRVIADNRIVGLLGSPNGNPLDDWMDPSGKLLLTAQTRIGQEAYQYCTANWCLRNRSLSRFVYEEGLQFQNFSRCDDPYVSTFDLSAASPALTNLCGTNEACLIDGLVGGVIEAEVTLNAQAMGNTLRSSSASFKFIPAVIGTNVSANVFITLNVSSAPANLKVGLSEFSLYRVDPRSAAIQGTALLRLRDSGSGGDLVPGDSVFSSGLPIRSATAGDVFAFRAVPVLNGVENRSSLLAITALSAVTSYSSQSGIGVQEETNTTVVVSSLNGLLLSILYSWPINVKDLDTSTKFLTGQVGFGCGRNTEYLIWSGDNTLFGGTEGCSVLLDQARKKGAWEKETRIFLYAGWFEVGRNDGPALVRIVLQNATTGEEVPGTALSLPVDPGSQRGCSSTAVGIVDVSIMPGGSNVEIELLPVS